MKHRLFVAISLPDSVRDQVVAYQNQLRDLGYSVDWEDPAKLHLTLNFLGRVPDDQLPAIRQVVRVGSAAASPFTLGLLYVATLYRRHDRSVVYLSVGQDLSSLKRLQKELSRRYDRLGYPQPRRFSPHLTLGYLPKSDPPTVKKTMDRISQAPDPVIDSFLVDKVSLYESFLSRAGSRYQKIGRFVLQSTGR